MKTYVIGDIHGAYKALMQCLEREVILDFTDDGPGIPPDQQTRIFDPFFTTRPVGEGTGLGLSVSANIIREHHGTITVENAPDKGAHFSICLPVVQSR